MHNITSEVRAELAESPAQNNRLLRHFEVQTFPEIKDAIEFADLVNGSPELKKCTSYYPDGDYLIFTDPHGLQQFTVDPFTRTILRHLTLHPTK